MDAIVERCVNILQGKHFPSLLIFPEGTTSNGTHLINFKKGAFAPMAPVKIFCLKYKNRYLFFIFIIKKTL